MRLLIRCFFYCLLLCPTVVFAQTANFTGTPVAGCAPLVVQFTSTSTGNITGYSWDLGNGVTTTLQNPSTTYLTPGTYAVTLTVTGPGGTNTKTVSSFVTVYSQPTVSFSTPDVAGCPPLLAHFTTTSVANAPGAMTYAWDFGDGSASTLTAPNHTYTASGFYTPSLVVTNSYGCSKTLAIPGYIHVYTPPTGNFSPANAVFCHPPAVANFTNNATGDGPLTSAWTFGDGGIGAGNTTSHSYAGAGLYTVTAITTDVHGCKDTVTHATGVIIYPGASFTVPSSGCPFDSIHFFNTSPGVLTSLWTFGDGGTDTAKNPSHAYNGPGTYTVTLVTDLGGCYDTLTQTILIHPQPGSNFTATPIYPCDTLSPVQFTATGAGVSWTWLFGDGSTGTGPNPVHGYHAYLRDTVRLITTSAFGCKDTVVKPDYIINYGHLLQIFAVPSAGCAPVTTSFSATLKAYLDVLNFPAVPWPYPVTSYTWDFGDGSPVSTLAAPSHTYTNAGVYFGTLTVTTANGCTFSRPFTISVGTPPVASFYATPTTACVKSPVIFVSTSTNVGPNTTYYWIHGDGGGGGNAIDTYKYSMPGTFTETLIVSNNGCIDSVKHINYITINPPNANFTDSIYCPASLLTVKLTNLSIGTTSQSWSFGDGTFSTQAAPPPHVYPTWGVYNQKLITYNSTTGCTDTFKTTLNLIQPINNFTALDTTICLQDTLVVTATTTPPASDYKWMFDNVSSLMPDTFITYRYVFPTKGYHTVTLFVHDIYGCLDTVQRTNYVLVSRPVPGFSASPVTGCTPMNVTFTDTSKYTVGTVAQSRTWRYGDGTTGTNNLSTISHSYLLAGLYDVTLIAVDNSGCADSVKKVNYIDAHHPTASFTPSTTTPCIGIPMTFYNNSTGAGTLTYVWDFGDGTSSTTPGPTHVYSSVGAYTVRLITTDNYGCKDTATATNLLSITKPHAAFTMSDTLAICAPLAVHFTNNSTGALAYQWAFGNGSPSTLPSPVNTYTAPGTYIVRLIAFNAAGCADTAYGQVRVLGYAGALTYTPIAGCAPLTVNFVASITNVPNLVWDFADGVTAPATGATFTHTYASAGGYLPKLIFSDGSGCVSSSQGLDTIKVDDVVAGFKILPPCVNTPVTFTDTSKTYYSALTTHSWNFGGGSTANGSPTSHLYPAAGTYSVTLISGNAGGCKDTVTQQVTIYDLPIITGIGDTTVCPQDPALLSAVGGVSYTWSPATTLSCAACTSPIASTATSTTYTVTGTDFRGCKNTDTVRVSIQYKTTSAVAPGGEICLGQSFQLVASGAQVYHWTPAESLDNASIAMPVATPAATTNYRVIATEGSCPADTNFVRVVVHPLPTVTVTGDAQVIAGGTASLVATGINATHYNWLPDPTLSCTACSNPTATPHATTTYTVIASTQYGCTDTASMVVHILCDASQVFIPNTFTPNHDGQNDYFYPRGAGLDHVVTFRVYSRWGEVVFERTGIQLNDESAGWDGTYKGQLLPPDVYVYAVDAICENGEPVRWKGDVTLMR